mgnify:CR=1 FL=1
MGLASHPFRRTALRPPPLAATEAARAAAPLPVECVHMDFVLATLSEVASALQYLHAQGFVHCECGGGLRGRGVCGCGWGA